MTKKQYLLDKIGKEKAWSISSIKKVPMFVGKYLLTNNPDDIEPATKEEIEHEMPTLFAINQNHSFDNTNRAYHLHAATNLVIGFDIENYKGDEFDKVGFKGFHRTDPRFLEWFKHQPAQYREYSVHYGLHLLYQLDPKRLSKHAKDMIVNRTECKLITHINGKRLEYEIMLNNHWLTLTRNTVGTFSDLSKPVPTWVYNLLEWHAKRWYNVQSKIEQILDVSRKASKLAKWLSAQDDLFDPLFIGYLKDNYNVGDFEDDDSAYEYYIAQRLAFNFLAKYNDKNEKHFPLVRTILSKDYHYNSLKKVPNNDIIWAIALALKKCVPPRAKDNEYRDNLPWLVYVSRQAWEYAKMPEDERKKFLEQKRKEKEKNARK